MQALLQPLIAPHIVDRGGDTPHHHADVRHIEHSKLHEEHMEHIHHIALEGPVDEVAHCARQQQGQGDPAEGVAEEAAHQRH